MADQWSVVQGNSAEVLKTLPDNSVDAVVTDPPYGINFLGKDWDKNTGEVEVYEQCLRVLKPGGYMLAFSAARTYHHLAMALETVGFEIRDQIMWIYSSGFPKSQDVGRSIQRSMDPEAQQWEGWGTNLKPAHEPIVMARKPLKQSISKNVQQWGTGALNIDATRIEQDSEQGRFPSNVLGDIPDHQKYFYCPKVSRKERHFGFDLNTVPTVEFNEPSTIHLHPLWDPSIGKNVYRLKKKIQEHSQNIEVGNNHPTVKPVALMSYLIKLVTPPGGLVLDPFNGSGSTGMAAVEHGFEYLGIDLDANYVEISKKRIESWTQQKSNNNFKDLFDE